MTSESPMFVHGRPWRHAGARGLRYVELRPELVRGVPLWIAQKSVEGGVELKPGRVWRLGDAVVKRFDPRRGLASRLRSAPALRCARSCARIAPLRTPRPWLAFVEEDDTSWLVTEFVAGKHLHAAFATDPAAADALPAFMAEMLRHGVIHGDLNVWNLLWDGHAWVLIDLEGLRGPLHRLRARAIGDEQWVRFAAAIRDSPRIAELYGRYLVLLGEQHTQAARWPAIERRAEALVRHYDRLIRESGERTPAG